MSSKALIDSIAKGAERLISENRRLRSEGVRLEAEKVRLKETNRHLAEKGALMERQLTVRDIASGFAGEETDRQGKKIARARVNRLLREVDKCMALLNRE